MTGAQAKEYISAQFATQWPVEAGAVPFCLENEALPSADTFAQLTIKHTRSGPRTAGSAGNRRKQVGGWIFVKIWGPADAGTAGTSALVDAACRVFDGKSLGSGPPEEPLMIYAGVPQEIGVDGRYYMTSVQFPFDYWARF